MYPAAGAAERPTGAPTPGGLPTAPPGGLPIGEEKTVVVRAMFDAIAPRYDLVNRLMTFGLDLRWRRQAARALGLPGGSRVLDLACGTGDLLTILRRAGLRPLGMDLSAGMLAANPTGLPLAQADGARLPLAAGSLDGVTRGSALRTFSDLGGVFDELGRVVRPGGRLSLLEVAEPERGPLRAGHRVWFHRAVPLIGALLSDADAYRYLPRSTAYLPAPAELRSMLLRSGFSTVNRRPLAGGLSQLFTATRRGLR
jgi:demethylmenaquinone methyltransferase/2-methoxy-6-polyprenyl-1,4-benzoquinol methylase